MTGKINPAQIMFVATLLNSLRTPTEDSPKNSTRKKTQEVSKMKLLQREEDSLLESALHPTTCSKK